VSDEKYAEQGTWFACGKPRNGYEGVCWELWDKNNDGGHLYLTRREQALALIAIGVEILQAMEEDGNSP